jgi:hypothetical protein
MKTHNNTIANLCRGVGERVLFTDSKGTKPVPPVVGIFESRLALYRDQLCDDLGYQSPVTHDQFVDFYKGPRKLIYQRAVDGLVYRPLRPSDAKLKTFVKAEKLNFSIKNDPAPRVIQPRSPRFNVEIGCYLRPFEKKVYASINKLFQSPTIMSEFNAYEQARVISDKWDKFQNPCCIGMDASRFDQHVSTQALKFEHTLYNSVFRSKKLRLLLRQQLVNHGVAIASDGSFSYTKYGSRMSGDMNTSLGNKILMCLMAKAYIDSLGFHIEFVNNGDDCLLILDKKNVSKLEGLESYFQDFGFKIVCETPVYQLEQVEFCQTKPVCVNNIWRMVRNVKTCLSKDMTCVTLGHNERDYRIWLKDVGTCGLATAGDVPVLGEFYRMLVRFGLDGKHSQSSDDEYRWYRLSSRNSTCAHQSPDNLGRLSFYISTGLIPDEQLLLEDYFRTAVWGENKRQLITAIYTLFNDK